MKIRIACTLNEQKKLTLQKKDAMHTSDGEIINIGADFIGQIFAIIIGKFLEFFFIRQTNQKLTFKHQFEIFFLLENFF